MGHARPAVYLSREIPRERVPGPLLHESQPRGLRRSARPTECRHAQTRDQGRGAGWSTYLVKYPRQRAPGRSSTSRSRGRSVHLAPEPQRKQGRAAAGWRRGQQR